MASPISPERMQALVAYKAAQAAFDHAYENGLPSFDLACALTAASEVADKAYGGDAPTFLTDLESI